MSAPRTGVQARVHSYASRLSGLPTTLVVGALVTAAVAGVALVGPLVLQADPNALHLKEALRPPGPGHPLGTDNVGRDVLTRLVYGASLDLQIGLFCVLPTFAIGTILGALAGLYRRFDSILMRVLDIVVAFPFYVLVIAIVAALGPGITNMYIAVCLVGWASYARLVRNETKVVTNLDYVAAVRVLRLPATRILTRHILPNVMVQPVVLATTNFVAYILLGSSLGYLGLGVQPPDPEWGVMIADGRDFLVQAPWISTFPGIAIIVVGIGLILLGDGLSDVLRPEVSRP